MKLHALLNPATATDCPAHCAAEDEASLQDVAFEGQLMAISPATGKDDSANASENDRDAEQTDLTAPDPLSDMIEALTGISASVPIRSTPMSLSVEVASPEPNILPLAGADLRSSAMAADELGGQLPETASQAAASIWNLPEGEAVPQDSELVPATAMQATRPAGQIQADEIGMIIPASDDDMQQTGPDAQVKPAPLRDQAAMKVTPASEMPDSRSGADNRTGKTEGRAQRGDLQSSDTHSPVDIVRKSTVDSAELGVTPTTSGTARASLVASQAVPDMNALQRQVRNVATDTSPPLSGERVIENQLQEIPDRQSLSLNHVDVTRHGNNQNSLSEPISTALAASDSSAAQDRGLANSPQVMAFKPILGSADVLAQSETRSVLSNPGSIIRQVVDAVVTTRNEMVEITLSPEELGRVRMVLTGHERAPHLAIWAERPDILDQMRRHADVLMQEFGDEGFSDATLSFQDDRRDDSDRRLNDDQLRRDDRQSLPDTHAAPVSADPRHGSSATLTGRHRIDIRI